MRASGPSVDAGRPAIGFVRFVYRPTELTINERTNGRTRGSGRTDDSFPSVVRSSSVRSFRSFVRTFVRSTHRLVRRSSVHASIYRSGRPARRRSTRYPSYQSVRSVSSVRPVRSGWSSWRVRPVSRARDARDGPDRTDTHATDQRNKMSLQCTVPHLWRVTPLEEVDADARGDSSVNGHDRIMCDTGIYYYILQ